MMLKSLFGDLGIGPRDAQDAFAATAILESRDARLARDGRIVDHHQQDLFVTGSPAQAMREHLALAPAQAGVRTMTLLDPSRGWAPSVIKALSDATGQPVERLNLRDRATLATVATIERTCVPRRGDSTLKIYHADLRHSEQDGESASIPVVLMERSQMAAVILAGMSSAEVDALTHQLRHAARGVGWSCPLLAFVIPPGSATLAHRLLSQDWPPTLQVEVITEPLVSASSAWNVLLEAWDRLQAPAADAEPPLQEARLLTRQLRSVLHTEGVSACALVDTSTGTLLAGEARSPQIDLALAASAAACGLRAQQAASVTMGQPGVVDELVISAGAMQQVVRSVARRPGLFLLVQLERSKANLALVRFKLAEAEKSLG